MKNSEIIAIWMILMIIVAMIINWDGSVWSWISMWMMLYVGAGWKWYNDYRDEEEKEK